MNSLGAPDLLLANRVSRGLSQVNRDLARASVELATGRREDPVAATGGDPARLFALDRDIASAETRRLTLGLAQGRSETAQAALTRIGDAAGAVGVDVAAAAARGDLPGAERAGNGARSAFETVVSALNARFGDRSLFAGAGVSGPATASADVILAEVAARVAPAADAAAALAAVDDYFFTDPAGFSSVGYLGSTSDAPAVELNDGERLGYAPRADDDAIRAALAALAKAVIATESAAPSLTQQDRLAVFAAAGDDGLAARDGVIGLQAALGQAEQRIEEASVRTEAEKVVLEKARAAILGRDPFEAASEFTALETQLQTLFAVTSRLSSLSLTNFLR